MAGLGGGILAIVVFLGLALTVFAPALRRINTASPALAGGALAIVVVSLVGLAHVDPRIGSAAIQENRREYLFFLACELPVFLLALLSWKGFKAALWVGWGINVALSIFVMVVVVWLEFFWHW